MSPKTSLVFPPSPSSSEDCPSQSQQAEYRQSHTLIEDALSRKGMPHEITEEWKRTYNRRSVPIMDDDKFCQVILNAMETHGEKQQVEQAVQLSVSNQHEQLFNQFDNARFDILLTGMACFHNVEQQASFASMLGDQISVHASLTFVASCLPELIKAIGKSAPHRMRKAAPKSRINKSRAYPKATEYGTTSKPNSPRRSTRIAALGDGTLGKTKQLLKRP